MSLLDGEKDPEGKDFYSEAIGRALKKRREKMYDKSALSQNIQTDEDHTEGFVGNR